MEWTKELPNKPGFYWYCYERKTGVPIDIDDVEIIQVMKDSGDPGELRIWAILGYDDYPMSLYKNGFFMGPIEIPNPPKKA